MTWLDFHFFQRFSQSLKKTKETVCKRIFRRTHKVQQKKSMNVFHLPKFQNTYFLPTIIKLHKTDLITSTLSVSYRTGSGTQYMSSISLLLSIDWWFEQKGSLINNLLLILYLVGVVQEISIIMVYAIHRWLMNAWRYTEHINPIGHEWGSSFSLVSIHFHDFNPYSPHGNNLVEYLSFISKFLVIHWF